MAQIHHRLQDRTRVRVPVVIHYRGVPVDSGEVVDASRQGLSVRGLRLALSRNTFVQVELRPADPAQPRVRLDAVVRHQSDDRTGLFITDPEGLYATTIRRLAAGGGQQFAQRA